MTKTEKRILYLMAREGFSSVAKATISWNVKGYLYVNESLEALEKQGLLRKIEVDNKRPGRSPIFYDCTEVGKTVVQDMIAAGSLKDPSKEARGGHRRKAG